MKRLFLICLLSLALLPARAAGDELARLVELVQSLPGGGEKAYNAAITTLAADELWTPMDELRKGAADSECSAADRVPGFRLNNIMVKAQSQNRRQVATGNHLNGADSRYCYSLYEKTLKSGKSATFTLPQRWGDQVIYIIPYDPKAKISASASGAAPFSAAKAAGGVIKLTGTAVKGQPLTLSVTNASGANLSYVVINYNSRK